MKTYPFMQVDAFTNKPLSGNSCAILFESHDLDDAAMLAIALENNLSETSFVGKSKVADFGVRYFTPGEEIPMAGHPTIATAFALVDTGRVKLNGEKTAITFELKAGVIPIEIFSKGDAVEKIVMTQMKPQFLKTYRPEDVMSIFDLSTDDLLPDVPIQTVSTGTPQLMIPLKNHTALRNAQVNIATYLEFKDKSDFFSPHLFCLEGITSDGQTFARHFGVPPDTREDPFTGSATGGMAAYLWHYNLIKEPHFIAEQGHWMHRPGKAFVEIVGPRNDIEAVKVGGQAVKVLQGEFLL